MTGFQDDRRATVAKALLLSLLLLGAVLWG